MTTTLPNCFINRNGTYYLRARIPKAIRDILTSGQGEIRKSLHTKQYTIAKQRIGYSMSRLEHIFRAHADLTMSDDSQTNIDDINDYYDRQAYLYQIGYHFIESTNDPKLDTSDSNFVVEAGERVVKEIESVRAQLQNQDQLLFRHQLQEFAKRLVEADKDFERGTLSPTLSKTGVSIDGLFNDLIHLKKTSNTKKNWKSEKTLKDRLRSIAVIKALFHEFAPNAKTVSDLSATQIRAVHSALKLLPKGKSVKEIVSLAPEIKVHFDHKTSPQWMTIQAATQCKYEDPLKAFVELADQLDYLPKNYLDSITHKSSNREKTSYAVFSDDDLVKLLNGEIYNTSHEAKPLGKRFREWHFWMIPLAIYTGARQAELAQLYLDDFKYSEEIKAWYIDISEYGGEGKSTKNQSSNRTLPVHPELIKAGLIEVVENRKEAGEKYLFPELWFDNKGNELNKPDSSRVTSWFSSNSNGKKKNGEPDYKKGYAERSGVVQDDREGRQKVFHSFRHTFINNLRASRHSKEDISPLTGHEVGEEVIHQYGNKVPLKVKYEVLKKLKFEGVTLEGLDFKHYQTRKPKNKGIRNIWLEFTIRREVYCREVKV